VCTCCVQSDWPAPMPAIGRIANFSSLRKHRPMENQIYDSYFGLFCFHSILAHYYYFWSFRTKPVGAVKLKKDDCSGCLFGGSERTDEGDGISPLKSNGQALKQECCLPGVLSDHCDPPANVLNYYYYYF